MHVKPNPHHLTHKCWLPVNAGGHWTPQLIHMAGGEHPLNPPAPGRGAPASIAVTNEAFAAINPDWVVLCPCGLDIQETLKEMRSITDKPWW